MSTNKTENLGLHSWVETDPVLMSEFNDNFNTLDAASQTFGNCRIITGSYVGTGERYIDYTNTLYFPHKPKWVYITPRTTGDEEVFSLESAGGQMFDVEAIRCAAATNSQGKATIKPIGKDANAQLYVWVEDFEDGAALCWYLVYGNTAENQSNSANCTYHYTAFC